MNDGVEGRGGWQSGISEHRAGQFYDVTGAPLPAGYSFIRMLGRGSMALVFLVRNTLLKRLVALKVLRKELSDDPVSRKRFIREAQAAARITHPCVTSVYTVGALDNDLPFIEMQYIDGRNLAEVLRGHGQFDVPAACELLTQLAAGLAAAHGCRVIHRNIDPTNVLIENDGQRVFLTDFGVAGILESGSEAVTRLTREGDCLGDPTYMSPEQLRGETVTTQSDIYGLGILGYEALTLQGPFGDADITDIAGAHLRRAPIDLHEVHPGIPRALSDVLKRCLSKKPEHRPSAGDLVAIFEQSGSTDTRASPGSYEAMPLPRAVAGFLAELQNRHVYRAAVAYVAVTFVILQAADLMLPPLDVPEWLYRSIVIASLAGFPLTLALAWAFDLRQGKLIRARDVDEPLTRRPSRKQKLLLQALGLIVSIAVAGAVGWWLLAR